MDPRSQDDPPAARTGMLIRRPVAEVFEAMVNPEITTQFWFTKSSGRLLAGQQVRWEWDMYDAAATVEVRAIDPDQRIVIEWPGEQGQNTVELTFAPHAGATFVSVIETGFGGAAVARQVADSTEGFALMLAGLKALLEHGIRLNLVADRFPQGLDPA